MNTTTSITSNIYSYCYFYNININGVIEPGMAMCGNESMVNNKLCTKGYCFNDHIHAKSVWMDKPYSIEYVLMNINLGIWRPDNVIK